jgi:hypothetical protein
MDKKTVWLTASIGILYRRRFRFLLESLRLADHIDEVSYTEDRGIFSSTFVVKIKGDEHEISSRVGMIKEILDGPS